MPSVCVGSFKAPKQDPRKRQATTCSSYSRVYVTQLVLTRRFCCPSVTRYARHVRLNATHRTANSLCDVIMQQSSVYKSGRGSSKYACSKDSTALHSIMIYTGSSSWNLNVGPQYRQQTTSHNTQQTMKNMTLNNCNREYHVHSLVERCRQREGIVCGYLYRLRDTSGLAHSSGEIHDKEVGRIF